MTQRRRSHRSFVSYVDKSREYYAAHGYDTPYQWATHDEAPFTPLPKPLSECKVGLVTTSYFLPEGFVYRVPGDLPRRPAVASREQVGDLETKHLSWDKKETHTEDHGSFLPLDHLAELAEQGRIGSVSDRFYCLPTQFSQRRTITNDAPRVLEWMEADGVDVAVAVPL